MLFPMLSKRCPSTRKARTTQAFSFGTARTFEIAGDLSTTERCAHYERAANLLEDRGPLLQGDQLALKGRTFPLAPLRKENERIVAEVQEKAAKAGCK